MATAQTYCTHRELKDVFPQVDSFDSKRALYGWVSIGNNRYIAENTGLITMLYTDGKKLNSAQVDDGAGYQYKTVLTSGIAGDSGGASVLFNTFTYNPSFTTGSESDIKAGDYVKLDKTNGTYVEIAYVESINTSANQITVRRPKDSATISASGDDLIIQAYITFTQEYSWYYDSNQDSCVLYSESNPNDLLVEAGEDFSTLITRITANASRYLDSRLNASLPAEQLKDKEGNYDYIIVRTTALIAAVFLIRSHDPNSEQADKMMEEVDNNMQLLNSGEAALSWQTTGDSSKGIIREVGTISGALRPVDTRGRYNGSWDLIQLKVTTAGVLGVATYSVFVKDSESLKATEVVANRKISGDYQALAGGLQIRFAGSADNSAAVQDDEWEIEVAGWQEEVDNSVINSVRMTRR